MAQDLGRTIIIFGIILVVVGFLFTAGSKIPGLGRLPGDILIKKENFTFYSPIATSVIISLVLTLLLNLIINSKR